MDICWMKSFGLSILLVIIFKNGARGGGVFELKIIIEANIPRNGFKTNYLKREYRKLNETKYLKMRKS